MINHKPTAKQLAYLKKIVAFLSEWTAPEPQTKVEASLQIDEAKKMWAIEYSGDTGDIY